MSLTVLSAIGAALAFVDALVLVALCAIAWSQAKQLQSTSYNQWENALFENWQAQSEAEKVTPVPSLSIVEE